MQNEIVWQVLRLSRVHITQFTHAQNLVRMRCPCFDMPCLHVYGVSACTWRHQKHDNANYDPFVPNLDMAYRTIKRASVPNLKSFGPTKTELWEKDISIMLYGKMGWGRTLANTHGCGNMEIFKTKEAVHFSIYWYIDLELSEIFQNGVIYIMLNFLLKKSFIQIFDDVIA